MNSPLRRNNYTKSTCVDCTVFGAGECLPRRGCGYEKIQPPARRPRLSRAGEALFAERVSARQGLSLSQRRVYPLRKMPDRRSGQAPASR
jgi:hypothetical protein